MATDFPANPSNGDTHAGFTYNSTTGAWESSASTITGTEPPVILTEPPTTTQSLNSDGTTSTVTMTAQDPDGFDITYGIAYKTAGNTLPSQLASATTINQSTGVYTFTPSTTASDAGSFTARLSATDGIGYTTRLVNFDLQFAYSSSQDAINDSATAGIQSFLINGTSRDLYYDGNGWILYASFSSDNTYDATNYPALVANRMVYSDIASSNGFAWAGTSNSNGTPSNYYDGVTDTLSYAEIAGRFCWFGSGGDTSGITISSWQGPSTATHIRTVWGIGTTGLSSAGTYLYINNTQQVYYTSNSVRTDDYTFNPSGTTPVWEVREADGIAGIEAIWFKY
jgi:hypothetical protein